MKKRIGIFILLIVLTLTLFFGVKALSSMGKNSVPYELFLIKQNKEYEVYEGNDTVLMMTYVSFNKTEGEENVTLEYEVVFKPVSEFEFKSDYIKLRSDYGKKPKGSNINFYDTDIELNTARNGYDIFNTKLVENVSYVFNFVIPKTLNDVSYEKGEIFVYIFNQYMF